VATEPPALRLLNPIGAAMPLATWRARPLVRARELIARALGLGHLELSGITPSGHWGMLMPHRMYFIDRATAILDGVDLGAPVHLARNPTIGTLPLPARGVLGIGQGAWRITDRVEYERTRAAARTS
jgi:hypothetical protein